MKNENLKMSKWNKYSAHLTLSMLFHYAHVSFKSNDLFCIDVCQKQSKFMVIFSNQRVH